MSTQFITTGDGARVAYDVTGEGPTLMLLHGAGKTRKDWHKVGYVDRLKDRFKIINVDIRGSGDSDSLSEEDDYTIEKICQDLEMVADAVGVDRFMIWGYSFGGNIARYMGAWSDRVTAIAMIGIPFGPAVTEEFDRFIDGFIKKHGPLAQAYREGKFDEKARKSAIKGRVDVWVACFQAMRRWPSIEAADLNCKALCLVGTQNSPTIDWLEANRDGLTAAGVQVETVKGLTHLQEFTQIDEVFPVVSSFFENAK